MAMLKQHEFYVYHQENRVYARAGAEPPVLAETCETPQAAHDKVQSIVNPDGRKADSFGLRGFNDPRFQEAISANCEEYVRAAYGRAGDTGE